MKNAFTLLELVFVIVIIGIMAKVGSSAFSPHYLQDDANFIVEKIREAQFLGIGNEHLHFGGSSSGVDYKGGCIALDATHLDENASKEHETNYKIHVELSGELSGKTICFDAQGRPHEDDFNGTLIESQKVVTLKYSNKEKNISIEPKTGFAIIKN